MPFTDKPWFERKEQPDMTLTNDLAQAIVAEFGTVHAAVSAE
ncbi:hypothetical protein [Streptomyces sp. NPDC059564]